MRKSLLYDLKYKNLKAKKEKEKRGGRGEPIPESEHWNSMVRMSPFHPFLCDRFIVEPEEVDLIFEGVFDLSGERSTGTVSTDFTLTVTSIDPKSFH